MRKWTKTAGMLFMAASAVCSGRWILAATADPTPPPAPAKDAKDAKAADDATDPFASPPSTQPTDAPATQPAKPRNGTSVVASQVNVSDTGTVEIHVNDANLVEVLRMLSLQSQKNIIASKEVRGTVTANLYDVTVKEALDAILHANGYDYREKGNFIYVYTTKEIEEIEKASRVKKTEVFRVYYSPAVNVATLLKPVLSKDAEVALTTPPKAGLDVDSKTTGGDDHAGEDAFVITDYPENLEKARKLIHEIDRRPQQVLVEATILVAKLNENNTLGVDFTVLGGVDFSTLGSINASSGSGTGGGTSGGSSGSSSGSSGGSSSSTSSPLIAGGPPSHALDNALTGNIIDNSAAGHLLNKGYISSQFGGSGLNLGIITHNVGVFLQALEGVTDTTVLANPKVLVLNKQKGEVHVGDELGYKTAVATETLTASSVSFLDTGTRLIFRPYIGENGYIRLEVHPEDSSGSIDTNGNPQKNTTEVTSNIMVKDGRTVVIGGLFRDSTTRVRNQVPFLGSLPGVGPLFRNQTDTTSREEIIILLTPHIVKDLDQYGSASEDEAKVAERLRVGMRRGLMPWGRERLAESWYEKAVEEMNKPHPNTQVALWHLNCAINLNPLFAEAQELRAQITGKEVTASDNSTIRAFVRKQVLADRAAGATSQSSPAVILLDDSAPATQTKGGAEENAKPQKASTDDAMPPSIEASNPGAIAEQPTNPAQPANPAQPPATQPGSSPEATTPQPATPATQPATAALPDDAVEDAPAPSDSDKKSPSDSDKK